MPSQLEILENYIRQLNYSVSEEALKDFLGIWSLKEVRRKETLTSPGIVEHNLYFVLEGVQRVFYHDDKDREATLVFTYPYSFAGVVDSFLLQLPSKYYFETLSASVLLQTTSTKLSSVISKHYDINLLIQKLSQHALSGVLERMVELQSFSSEEKFRTLLKRSPQILKHVPHKYLANYLGIDATNFSKLINSVKI